MSWFTDPTAKRAFACAYDRWQADKASAAKARRKTTYDARRLGLQRKERP